MKLEVSEEQALLSQFPSKLPWFTGPAGSTCFPIHAQEKHPAPAHQKQEPWNDEQPAAACWQGSQPAEHQVRLTNPAQGSAQTSAISKDFCLLKGLAHLKYFIWGFSSLAGGRKGWKRLSSPQNNRLWPNHNIFYFTRVKNYSPHKVEQSHFRVWHSRERTVRIQGASAKFSPITQSPYSQEFLGSWQESTLTPGKETEVRFPWHCLHRLKAIRSYFYFELFQSQPVVGCLWNHCQQPKTVWACHERSQLGTSCDNGCSGKGHRRSPQDGGAAPSTCIFKYQWTPILSRICPFT